MLSGGLKGMLSQYYTALGNRLAEELDVGGDVADAIREASHELKLRRE